jgi:hypothetical protein
VERSPHLHGRPEDLGIRREVELAVADRERDPDARGVVGEQVVQGVGLAREGPEGVGDVLRFDQRGRRGEAAVERGDPVAGDLARCDGEDVLDAAEDDPDPARPDVGRRPPRRSVAPHLREDAGRAGSRTPARLDAKRPDRAGAEPQHEAEGQRQRGHDGEFHRQEAVSSSRIRQGAVDGAEAVPRPVRTSRGANSPSSWSVPSKPPVLIALSTSNWIWPPLGRSRSSS